MATGTQRGLTRYVETSRLFSLEDAERTATFLVEPEQLTNTHGFEGLQGPQQVHLPVC